MSILAMLVPLTPEARAAARDAERIPIHRFPFRVGRESRLAVRHGMLQVAERRKLDHPPNNDLYLLDTGNPLNVSREHFQIEEDGDGGFVLVDRGSACGTLVGDQAVGGEDRGGRATLTPGNVIVVGTSASPYIYKFLLAEA